MLYTVTLNQVYLGVKTSNIFNYYTDSAGSSLVAEGINQHFVTNVLPAINAFQNNAVINATSYCLNATNGLSSNLKILTGGGTNTTTSASALPPFYTLGIRWTPGTEQYGPRSTIVKRGYTRLSGLNENCLTNGTADPTILGPLVTNLYNALKINYTGNPPYTFQWVIHVPQTPETNGWKVAVPIGTAGYKFTTQSSRKS